MSPANCTELWPLKSFFFFFKAFGEDFVATKMIKTKLFHHGSYMSGNSFELGTRQMCFPQQLLRSMPGNARRRSTHGEALNFRPQRSRLSPAGTRLWGTCCRTTRRRAFFVCILTTSANCWGKQSSSPAASPLRAKFGARPASVADGPFIPICNFIQYDKVHSRF